MAQQNINQKNYKKWYVKSLPKNYDLSLASDELNYNQEVIFSNDIMGSNDGNFLPIHFDLNNSGSSQMLTINYGDYFTGNTLVSLNYYNPNNEDLTCFSSSTLCDIGLTGIDNGLTNQISGETLYYTMGLYTGQTKWDRLHYDRRLKFIQITANTSTTVIINLESIIEPGSIISTYNLYSDQILVEDLTVNFTNSLGLIGGGFINIITGVTISQGQNSGTTTVTTNDDFNNLNRTFVISGVTFDSSQGFYLPQVTPEIIFASQTPTPSITPTITPTPSITQTNTSSATPTSTPSPTPSMTQTNTSSITPTITPSTTTTITPTNSETPATTPTSSITQTSSLTPTSSITPSITQTSTPTNSVTPTITPSSSSSGGGIVSSSLFMKLEGSDYSGSGQWLDGTVNGNNGTINGATYLSDYGGIFDFDGINDTISVAHTSNLSLSTTQQRTVQVWVRFDEIPSLNTQIPVFGKLSSLSGFDGYWGGLFSNGGVVRVTTNGTSAQKVSDSTLTISSNTWYLFTFISQITSALNTTKVYINETEYISTQHGSDTYSESNPFYLGFIGSGVGSLYLNGKIGACYFYTKGLNTSEISQNYNNTKDRYF